MILLDYSLDSVFRRDIEKYDLASADMDALEWRLFCGDIIFQVDSVDFNAKWAWVPVIGFALQLYILVEHITNKHCSRLNFTESDDYIQFCLIDELIHINASYTENIASVAVSEIQQAAQEFLIRILNDITYHWPELQVNIHIKRLREELELRE